MEQVTKSFKLEDKNDRTYRIVCRECARKTLHSVVCSYNEDGSVESKYGNILIDWGCKNQIIQCLGCETVSFRKVAWNSECMDPYNDAPVYDFTYYPAHSEGLTGAIEQDWLPLQLQSIYKETIFSIENNQYILAGVGIRAIVEAICKEKNVVGRDLYKKINSLKEEDIVTPDGAHILHKLRVLGNDAAHEVKAHTSDQLELAMKIINHMLEATYIIPSRVQQVFPQD